MKVATVIFAFLLGTLSGCREEPPGEPVKFTGIKINPVINGAGKLQLNDLSASPQKKLVFYFNGDCSVCVDDLDKLSVLITQHQLALENVNIILIARSDYPHMLKYQLAQKTGWNTPIFLDFDKTFLTANKLEDILPEKKVLLLDKNNRIVYRGPLTLNAKDSAAFSKIVHKT